jgi:G3E family GTPase
MTDASLAERFVLGRVTTLVDSLLGAATLATHIEARRQLAFADHVVVTKTDLAPADAGLLASIAAAAPMAAVGIDRPDPGVLFAPGARLPVDAIARHTGGIGACLIRRVAPVPALALTLLLEALAEQCGDKMLRFKGLFDVAEAPGRPAVVHAVQHVVSPVAFLAAWPDPGRSSRAVVIGHGIPPHFPARLLDAICAEVVDEMRRG